MPVPAGVENLLDVLQRLGGLLTGGVSGQFAGRGVDAQLAGHEHEPVGLYRLAVRAQRHGASDVATASIFSLMTPHSPRVSAIIVCVATRLCTLTV